MTQTTSLSLDILAAEKQNAHFWSNQVRTLNPGEMLWYEENHVQIIRQS